MRPESVYAAQDALSSISAHAAPPIQKVVVISVTSPAPVTATRESYHLVDAMLEQKAMSVRRGRRERMTPGAPPLPPHLNSPSPNSPPPPPLRRTWLCGRRT